MKIKKITAILAAFLVLVFALSSVAFAAEQITEAQAKAIALEHAGLKEADVTFLRVKLERDDGRWEYEVEFYSGNREYDYEIDAKTGAILSFDSEVEYRGSGSGWFSGILRWLQERWNTIKSWFIR